MKRLLVSLLLASPAAAADCPELYERIREKALRSYGYAPACADLRRAAGMLPLKEGSVAAGEWSFAGEEALRDSLTLRYGSRIPREVLPIGAIEREAPGGGPTVVIVFALSMPDRLAGLLRLARTDGEVPQARLAELMGDETLYDRVGFFVREGDGRWPPDGRWISREKGARWSGRRRKPEGTRVCIPCTGWLCPASPIACFSDFTGDRREEVHLVSDCRGESCRQEILEPGGKEPLRKVFSWESGASSWKERPEGWALVSEPVCGEEYCARDGRALGAECRRPEVHLFERGGRAPKVSAKLRDEYFPVTRKAAPADCEGGVLTWTKDGGFVLYETRR